MARRDEILHHLAEYLDVARFADASPKGLQVEGREEVQRIVTGVSANLGLFEKAVAAGADMILVHHGLFWKSEGPVVVAGPLARRLRTLLASGITLAGYHLPLDAHAEVGNNALALRALGATDLEPWGKVEGEFIGWRGRFTEPVPAAEFLARVGRTFERDPLAFAHGPPRVATVAVVSGAGQSFARQAAADGLHAFVTGEVSEWNMSHAAEHGYHFASAGHHATERLGIRALGEHVARRFGVEHAFIDVPNPV